MPQQDIPCPFGYFHSIILELIVLYDNSFDAYRHSSLSRTFLFLYMLVTGRLSHDNRQIEIFYPLQVNESFPFPIALSWKGSAPDAQNGAVDNQQSTVVFPKGNPIPSVKALTFYRSGTFTLDVHYADASELQAQTKISTYTVTSCAFLISYFMMCTDALYVTLA